MSALCAYPSLVPSGGFAGLAHSSSVVGLGGSYAIPANVDSHGSRHHGYSISARSQFTYAAYANASASNLPTSKSEKLAADTQSGSLWTQEPAAKRRCTDKSRSGGGWSTDVGSTAAIWSQQQQSSRSTTSSVCPSGCAMCHQQQQQQQHHHQQQMQQQHYQSQMESANRRPLQERHQNRLMSEESLLPAASATAGPGSLATPAPPMKSAAIVASPMLLSRSSRSTASSQSSRQLCVDPKKDYSSPLHVDCSVEYDLPRVVRPPPGAQPLLMLAPRRQQPSSLTPSLSSVASHGNHVGRSDVLYQTQQHPRHPSTLMSANNQAVWNATNAAALATALVGDWTTPKQPKLINKSTASGGNSSSSSNILKNASTTAARPMVAAPAPNLMGGNVGGAMLQRNSAVAAGQCGCPSCIGRQSAFSGTPSAAAAAVRVQSAWSHWSPPIGATAAAVYQQQHQRAVASFQLPGVTYVDQQPPQQQVNPRRRKRTDESADKSSMSGLYTTSAAWMNAQTAAAAAAADAAFAAANRFAAAAPWMTNPAPHLKFPC